MRRRNANATRTSECLSQTQVNGRIIRYIVITPFPPEGCFPLYTAVALLSTQIDLGQIALNHWVNPTLRLLNTRAEPVTITIPQGGVQVLEGC